MKNSSKKIAVCLPSYNEAKNIKNITKKVDKALKKINKKYKCYIVNADNNSTDKTSILFINTQTRNEKIVLASKEKGKGINVINFMKFCKENNIDYAFTIDTDLKSFKSNWIKRMLKQLKYSDFVCPLYKRSRYEGNTTNHFVVPIIKVVYNRIIRQPIGGDYAFNKEFINIFNDNYYNNINEIKQYGIDIYLVILALTNNLKINEVKLGSKIHAPSYMKMFDIFENVANSLETCIKKMPNYNNEKNDNWMYNSISNNKKSDFSQALLSNKNYIYSEEKEKWLNELVQYLKKIKNNEQIDYKKLKESFKRYTYSYWSKYANKSSYQCEKCIKQFCNNLEERHEKKWE